MYYIEDCWISNEVPTCLHKSIKITRNNCFPENGANKTETAAKTSSEMENAATTSSEMETEATTSSEMKTAANTNSELDTAASSDSEMNNMEIQDDAEDKTEENTRYSILLLHPHVVCKRNQVLGLDPKPRSILGIRRTF